MSTPMKKRPIGSIFVEKGFVTQEQLDDALRDQQRSGQRLGEILVERGHISRIDLASVIGNQLEGLRLLQGGLAANAAPAAAVAPVAPPVPDRSGEIAELERRLANQAETIDHLLDQVNELQAAVAAAEARACEPEPPAAAEPAGPTGLVVVDP
jgi:hypothetical protein